MPASDFHASMQPQALSCTARVMQSPDVVTAEEWDELSRNAIEENPFFSRRYIRAGLLAFGQQGLRMVMIRDHYGTLRGLVPFRTGSIAALLAGPEARIPLNCYQADGVPLIDRGYARAALTAFVDLITGGQVPGRWVLPQIGLDGPFFRELDAVTRERGLLCHAAHRFDRPILRRLSGGFDEHAQVVIGRRRVKDIERNLRRLGELGHVRFERATEHAAVRLRLESFLAMENAGWKGTAGTAFLARPDHARFARFAFGGKTEAEGIASVDSLLLDGVPIAHSVNIRTGRRIFSVKCTYDETYRKYGPGMVLEYLVIQHFYAGDDGVEMDAATTAPGHVIAGLWNESRPMGVVAVGVDNAQTRLAIRLQDAHYRGRAALKRILRRG